VLLNAFSQRAQPASAASSSVAEPSGGTTSPSKDSFTGLVISTATFPARLVGVLLGGAESVRSYTARTTTWPSIGSPLTAVLTVPAPGDVGGDRLGALEVLADDGEVMTAREHAAADAPRHVAGTDYHNLQVLLFSARGG
jgi:hypothetical protein